MRLRRWVVLACLVLGLFLILGPVREDEAWADGSEEQRLMELIKGYRQANSLGPLVPSGTLSVAAGRHSEDMAEYGFFSHTSEASSYYPVGASQYDRLALEGYPAFSYTTENIAFGQLTAQEVFEVWLLSPAHNANMLDGSYTSIGIGHAGPYWTANFGTVT
jgi:uncharacterized protein YkwD